MLLCRYWTWIRRSVFTSTLPSSEVLNLDSRQLPHPRWLSDDTTYEDFPPSISHVPDPVSKDINRYILGVTKQWTQDSNLKDSGTIFGSGYVAKSSVSTDRELKLTQALDRLLTILRSKFHRIDHINIVTILHQLGAIGASTNLPSLILAHPLFKELLGLVPARLNQLEAFHVVNVIWTMAQLGQASLHVEFDQSNGFQLVELLLTRATQLISTFQPQSLSQLAHSLAQLDFIGVKEFLSLLAVVAKAHLEGFTPWDISVLFYSLAAVGYEDHVGLIPPLLARLEDSMEMVDRPQQVVSVVWAIGKFQIHHLEVHSLMDKIMTWSENHIHEFQLFEMEIYLNVLVKMRYHPTEVFLQEFDIFIENNSADVRPRFLSVMLTVCADLQHISPPLLAVLDRPLVFQDDDIIPGNVSAILRSLAILNQLTLERYHWGCTLLKDCPLDQFSNAFLVQIAQSMITFHHSNPSSSPKDHLPGELVKMSLATWYDLQLNSGIPSFIRYLFFAFTRLGYRCEPQLISDWNLHVCIVVNPSGRRLVVEVDLPSRFFFNRQTKLLGRALWKSRLVEADGWRVLRVTWKDWPRDLLENQVSYLKELIDNLEMKNEGTSQSCILKR